jgi:hypothetical protein
MIAAPGLLTGRLTKSVGAAAPNRPADVAIVQDLLNRALPQAAALPVDGHAGPLLLLRIGMFQDLVMGVRNPDQRIDPFGPTLARLIALANPPRAEPAPVAAAGVLANLDTAAFQRIFRQEFGAPPRGLPTLLARMRSDAQLTDLRWAAYMLATAMWETAGTFEPIEEYGRGAGRRYGEPANFIDSAGQAHAHLYYGRGYVQITWLENYLRLGRELGLGEALAVAPERALDPEIAYRILAHGMRRGCFTGVKLADCISGSGADYVQARRIINRLDRAEEIADRANRFEQLLRIAA